MSIKLIVMDVDGTMTDGSIIYSQSGEELKAFDVKDGLGIVSWGKLGRETAIITGRDSAIVTKRAKELRIDYIRQGVKSKVDALFDIAKLAKVSMSEVAVIGDDWNDYEMMKIASISFAPQDATEPIKQIADYILKSPGGKGAVREMIDILIEKEGLALEMQRLWSADLS